MTNVLTVQIRPRIGEREQNFAKVRAIIEQYRDKKPDLILMSEFFNTGISRPAFERLAEEESLSPTLEYFSKVAKEYNTYVLCGSIIEKDGEKLYNTSYLLNRGGEKVAKYRKINLFNYFGGTEGEYVTPGEEIVVVECRTKPNVEFFIVSPVE